MQNFIGYIIRKKYSVNDFFEPLIEAAALTPLSLGIVSQVFFGTFELAIVSDNHYINAALIALWVLLALFVLWRRLR